jgi:hypothetical protein
MRIVFWLAAAAAVLLAHLAHAAAPAVPAALDPWRGWVLHGFEHRACPLRFGQMPGAPEAHACAWPGVLVLDVDARGARFAIDWLLLTEATILLPGDARQRPVAVRANGRDAAIVLRDDRPQLALPAGRHGVEGRFDWTRRPEQLALPAEIGMVTLRIDGADVVAPERDAQRLWLGRAATVAAPAGEDALALRVYRMLSDGEPLHWPASRAAAPVAGSPGA